MVAVSLSRVRVIIVLGVVSVLIFTAISTSQAQQGDVSGEVDKSSSSSSSSYRHHSEEDDPHYEIILDELDLISNTTKELPELIRDLVPSFTVNTQPISDGSTISPPFNLRGQSANSTLVTINSKRRHRGAVVSWFAPEVSQGAQGVDLTLIPAIALQKLEIGYAPSYARYGSDTAGGLMNFVLKEDNQGLEVVASTGIHFDGDGLALSVAGNVGLPLPILQGGFVNLSLELNGIGDTDRSVQRSDAVGTDADSEPVQSWGKPEINNSYKFFYNSALQLNDSVELYSFGNYSAREVSTGFYYRSPLGSSGVYSFTDGSFADGTPIEFRVIGDTTTDGTGACPTRVDILDNAILASLLSNSNCFIVNEAYANGFTPVFGGDVTDYSVYGGLRGESDTGLEWDFSAGVGGNSIDYFLYNSINPSLGSASPFDFEIGGNEQKQANFALDLKYKLDATENISAMVVSGGVEWRNERYTITTGQVESFQRGDLADDGFAARSHGFPGFSEDVSGSWSTEVFSTYVGVDFRLQENLYVHGSVRYEDARSSQNNSFASNSLKGGVTISYSLADGVFLRASYGKGSRLPTPAQINASNEFFGFIDTGLSLVATVPSTNSVATLFGGTELQNEDHENFSVGFAMHRENLNFTADCYQIAVDDRISLSRNFSLSESRKRILEEDGYSGVNDWDGLRFFTNGMDITTSGCDANVDYGFDWGVGRTVLGFAWSRSDTVIRDYVAGLVDDAVSLRDLEDGIPKDRGIFTANHSKNNFDVTVKFRYYDAWYDAQEELYFDGYGLVDILVRYKTPFGLDITAGVDNILNQHPEENPNSSSSGAQYSQYAPAGFNGLFGYLKVGYKFDW